MPLLAYWTSDIKIFFELQFHNRTIHRPFEVRSLQSRFVADSDFGYGNSSEGETFLYHRIVSALFESQSGSARSFTINFEAKHPKVHSLLAIFTSRSTLNQLQGKKRIQSNSSLAILRAAFAAFFAFDFLFLLMDNWNKFAVDASVTGRLMITTGNHVIQPFTASLEISARDAISALVCVVRRFKFKVFCFNLYDAPEGEPDDGFSRFHSTKHK